MYNDLVYLNLISLLFARVKYEKISLLLMVSASSLFLTGCWKEKKDVTDVKVSGIVLSNNESHKTVPNAVEVIEYVDSSEEYR